MQGIYNAISDTNHVFCGIQCYSCSVFTVCATCNVISPVKYVLYFYISIFRSVCVCVQCTIWLFFVVP
jgi:ABC-type amino acid transport system permease subunit